MNFCYNIPEISWKMASMSQNKNMNIFNALNIDSDEESTNMEVAKDTVKEVAKEVAKEVTKQIAKEVAKDTVKEVTKKKQRHFDESLFTVKTE